MSSPLLSVIVPAFRGTATLPQALSALAANDLPRGCWELIVVDDASDDGTSELARTWADHVVSLPGRPHGPAFARNRGVEASTGLWLVFIDSDVVVHADALRLFASVIERHPDVDAVFGAYDEAPPAKGFLSQYRNLLHRYVHRLGSGEADTFWAGCGAVRRTAFVAVGGFDERRYTRPQIEDIELGYRLKDRGGRILLRPEIQGTHLKRWTLIGSTRTDLLDRGIPWIRLLLERGKIARPANLNLARGERLKTGMIGVALVLMLGALLWRRFDAAFGAALLLLAVELSNLRLLAWFARQRGVLFALAVIPMNLWYYFVSGLSVVFGFALHLARGSQQRKSRNTREMALDTARGRTPR